MAENAPRVPSDGTPEAIAYRLFEAIILSEKNTPNLTRDRKYALDTYAECLRTVRDPNGRSRE